MTRFPAPDRWRRIAPLLEEAIDLPADRRGAFLDRACAGDPGLRAELEGLLRADSAAGSFLGAPVDLSAIALPGAREPGPASDPSADAGPRAGTSIGQYRVVREIGRGGMGVVYEAEQQQPRRPVALKVILGGRHVDAEAVRMFRRETDSLARLRHPSIASIFESGSTDEGQHFFAMELVRGRMLSEYLEENGPVGSRRDLRQRLALFRKITNAVAYAHQRGVIHRDLKPSNILVLESPRDGAEEAPDIKVLDFGLARITDPEAEAATAVTAIGRIQGTLPYMSPEQVRGRRDEVDARTDVYSLGVILYRMLSGRLPYDVGAVEFPEAARIVCEQAPRPLSAATDGRVKFDKDLTVIVLRALEKEPVRRYATVAALDDDLARYLAGQPILARPASAAYQIRKLVARHKAPFAGAGAVILLLAAFAIFSTLQARRIAAERDRANREAKTAVRVSDFLTGLFKVSDPRQARGKAVTAREILDKGVEKIEKELADEPEVQARLMLTIGVVYENLGDYEKATPMLERSVEMRRRLLGEEHLETLASMNALALQYQLMGRASEAEKLYEKILGIRRRLQGDDHPETLNAMAGLADVYWSQGRYAEKEKLDRAVLEDRRRVLGDDHPDTVSSMVDVAYASWLQGRFAEAEALYREALERERRLLGDDHPNTLLTMHNLANVYDDLGRHAEAEVLLRQTLDADRRVLGDAHPSTLALMNDLAMVLQNQERYGEAEVLLREALGQFRRVLGEDHRETVGTMANLGNVISDQGRYAEAEALLREALDKERRLLGEDYPDTISTLYSLGCVAALRGDGRKALDWLGEAVAHGYSTADNMAKDTHLKNLRGDPAFEALVARARKNASR